MDITVRVTPLSAIVQSLLTTPSANHHITPQVCFQGVVTKELTKTSSIHNMWSELLTPVPVGIDVVGNDGGLEMVRELRALKDLTLRQDRQVAEIQTHLNQQKNFVRASHHHNTHPWGYPR